MGAPKDRLKLICRQCGGGFERLECQVGRGRGKFCSKKCYDASQFHGEKIICFLCNKKVYRAYSEQDVGVKEKQFCSRECYFKWRKGKLKETTYPKNGSAHIHRIVVEDAIGRKLLPEEIVHHIDGNKHNYSLENLMVLPDQATHARLHFGEIKNDELQKFIVCK